MVMAEQRLDVGDHLEDFERLRASVKQPDAVAGDAGRSAHARTEPKADADLVNGVNGAGHPGDLDRRVLID